MTVMDLSTQQILDVQITRVTTKVEELHNAKTVSIMTPMGRWTSLTLAAKEISKRTTKLYQKLSVRTE